MAAADLICVWVTVLAAGAPAGFLPFSLSLAVASFMASFLFLLAMTLACTPLMLGRKSSSVKGRAETG